MPSARLRRGLALLSCAVALTACPSVPPFAGREDAAPVVGTDAGTSDATVAGDAAKGVDADATGPQTDAVRPQTDAMGAQTDGSGLQTDATGPQADATGPQTDAAGPQTDATGPQTDAQVVDPDANPPATCVDAIVEHRPCHGAAGDQHRVCAGETWGDWSACVDLPTGFVRVPAGRFSMGSPEDEPGREPGETLHEVVLTRTLAVKATEVTQGEWMAVMGGNPSRYTGCGRDCPVEQVTFGAALAYCNALSAAEGLPACYDAEGRFSGPDCRGYRLPSEAEWEYAARAGTQTAYFTGPIASGEHVCVADPNLLPVAWYCSNANPESSPRPVGQLAANPWGLLDVLGNVWEWTQDWEGAYAAGPQTDPTGPAAADQRVLRGCGSGTQAWRCRAATRFAAAPDGVFWYVGLRPVRTL